MKPETATDAADAPDRPSYGHILRSSALIGGASLITVLASVLRTKAMAVMLGPAGIGLAGIYGSIADLTRSTSLLGIGSSGVRQIAEASASGDLVRMARVVTVVRRVALLLALLGAAVLIFGRRPIAELSFGSDAHSGAVALLGLAVLFGVLADAQGAVLQGTRRIRALADIAVATALAGTVITVAMVWALDEAGIVPSLVATAAVTAAVAAWHCRRVGLRAPPMSLQHTAIELRPLLQLGIAFAISGLSMAGAGYASRIAVAHQQGLEGAGLYQGAWMVGGVYVGFILQAMSTDFYPRLVGAATDDQRTNRLVNEQAQVSLLLAGPGVLATLTLAPLVLSLLYSSRFDAAAEVLRWICLGMAMRVITWPMGFILVARGRQALFLGTDLAWALCNVSATWVGLQWFGLPGAGIAFFVSYLLHGAIVYPLVRRLSGFRWSAQNLRLGTTMLALSLVAFAAFAWLPAAWATAFGLLLTAAASLYSVQQLLRLAPMASLPRPVRWLQSRFAAGTSTATPATEPPTGGTP